jgi:hypothetical protein
VLPQDIPQVLQLFGSLLVSTQMPPQPVWPWGQVNTHNPPEQT